jgi:hypothetical protein
MRYLERVSINIYKIAFSRQLEKFRGGSIESVLRRAMSLIDEETKRDIKEFIRDHQSGTGAFVDKAGRSDLYYTLFGYLTASALDMKEIMPVLKSYIENEIQNNKLSGVNLYCAAVICPGLCDNQKYIDFLRDSVRNNLEEYLQNKGAYGAF